ncbi:MAG: hypothetical protein ACKOTA_03595, partial [Solirubrobacterales bacterium]
MSEAPPRSARSSVDRRLLRSVRAARLPFAAAIVLGVLTAVLVVAQASLLGRVIAGAFPGGEDLAGSAPLLWLLAGVIALRALCAGGFEASGRLGAGRVMSELRSRITTHLLHARPTGLREQRSGELVEITPYAVADAGSIPAVSTFAPVLAGDTGVNGAGPLAGSSRVRLHAPRPYVPFRTAPGELGQGVATKAEIQPCEHETRDRIITGFVVGLPFVLAIVFGIRAWGESLNFLNLGMFIVGYVLTCLGVTMGFHRLFTHRSFKCGRTLQITLAILGSMAVEGPLISWVSDHRRHHAHSDKPGDPHSPHVDHGEGFVGSVKGLWHAHMGWLFMHD